MCNRLEDSEDQGCVPILSELDAVRLRPGMYIGDTDFKGLHHLAGEIIDNAVQEAFAGYCTEIDVELYPHNRVLIKDNGRGISVSAQEKTKSAWLEMVLLELRLSRAKDYFTNYRIAGALHGLGLFVVNALCAEMIVETHWQGSRYRIQCSRGKQTAPLENLGHSDAHGTIVTLIPDRMMFPEEIHFSARWFRDTLRELAYLNPKVRFTFNDTRTRRHSEYHFSEGILQWVHDMNRRHVPMHVPIFVADITNGVHAEIAFLYHTSQKSTVRCFANNVENFQDCDQKVGFFSGLIAGIADYAAAQGEVNNVWGMISEAEIGGALSKFWYDDEHYGVLGKHTSRRIVRAFSRGLSAIISVWVPRYTSHGACNNRLDNPEAKSLVHRLTYHAIHQLCSQSPDIARQLVTRFKEH